MFQRPHIRQYLPLVIVAACSFFGLTGQTRSEPEDPRGAQKLVPWLSDELDDALQQFDGSENALARILQLLPLAGTGEMQFYIVEGDIRMTKDGVRQWVKRITRSAPHPEESERTDTSDTERDATHASNSRIRKELHLLRGHECGMYQVGAICMWDPIDQRRLRYFFDWSSFDSNGVPRSITKAIYEELAAAAESWRIACSQCDIRFTSVDTLEWEHNPAFFVVRFETHMDPKTNALSFPPYAAPSQRFLSVGPHMLNLAMKEVASGSKETATFLLKWRRTLRHEIGHILGYAHEELFSSELLTCLEPMGTPAPPPAEASSHYDRYSVMHSTACINNSYNFQSVPELSCEDAIRHYFWYRHSRPARTEELNQCKNVSAGNNQ